jgi:hypothetical protein
MQIYLFVKNNCPLCVPAKMIYAELDRTLPSDALPVLFNVDEDPGGLALFQFYEFCSTPTIAIVNKNTDEIYRFWSGAEMPTTKEVVREVAKIL